MKRYGNLFNDIIAPKNLEIAFEKAAVNKWWQHAVQNTAADLDSKLKDLRERMASGEYTTSAYRIKKIYEPKERDIYILPFYPDRIAQHAIMNIVEPIWQSMFIKDSFACVKQRGPHKGSRSLMQMLHGSAYCLKCDVRKFYPSIDHDTLYSIIEHKIKCKRTLALMQDIIYSLPGAKNIPIGNYTSQWMGNLYLNELDQLVKTRMKIQKYVRYCDDFIILDNDKAKLQGLKSEIIGFLQERLKLVLGKADVFPTSHGIDFLGYRHFPGGYILLRKSTAKRIKKRCACIDGLLSAGMGDKKRMESQVSSAIGWIMWANTHHLKEKCKMEELLWRIRNGG